MKKFKITRSEIIDQFQTSSFAFIGVIGKFFIFRGSFVSLGQHLSLLVPLYSLCFLPHQESNYLDDFDELSPESMKFLLFDDCGAILYEDS